MFCLFSTFRCSYLKLFRSYKKMFTSIVSESWQQHFIWDQISRQTNIVTCTINIALESMLFHNIYSDRYFSKSNPAIVSFRDSVCFKQENYMYLKPKKTHPIGGDILYIWKSMSTWIHTSPMYCHSKPFAG